MIFVLFFFLVFALLLLFVISSAFWGFLITRVPYVRTAKKDIEFIANELNILSSDIFYDLGSGDGKVCFLINKLTGAKCVGFELTWWTYALSALKSKLKNQNVKFEMQDFFKSDWSEATIIYTYLFPMYMRRVEEKFLNDCKPGTVAVIRDFPFPNLKADKKYYLPKEHEIYIYRK